MGRRRSPDETAKTIEETVLTTLLAAKLPPYVTREMVDRAVLGIGNIIRELHRYEPKYRHGQKQNDDPSQTSLQDVEGTDLGWKP